MNLSSSAFEPDAMIPARYTCDGADISPALSWSGAPPETRSFALICDDPDAPAGTWVHWVYFNLPADADGLPEQVSPDERPSAGGLQGVNDFKKTGYGGPCPPSGTHRYFFKLYALDTMLDLQPGASKSQLESAMEGHILNQAELMGKYER